MNEFRAGFVAIVGKPNVGKSTLVNAYLGQKIAAVSSRPQTTRRRQLGILTLPNAQVVFVDTPGIHLPRHKLGQFFNQEAAEALEGVDVDLFLVDASVDPDDEDRRVADMLLGQRRGPALFLGLNKIDLIPTVERETRQASYQAIAPGAKPFLLSASRGDGRTELLAALIECLPVRPPEFPPEQITDQYEREIAAELIREAALVFLREEVPHALAVRLDEFTERGEAGAYIAATLFVERESQKGIVIGEAGGMLKRIGSLARQEIEAMSGRKVYLSLRVKVEKDWRDNEAALRRFGYKIKPVRGKAEKRKK
jgi:GTP-binding protein Era